MLLCFCLDGTAMAGGAFIDSEIAQRLWEALEAWDRVYPIVGHPIMLLETGAMCVVSDFFLPDSLIFTFSLSQWQS